MRSPTIPFCPTSFCCASISPTMQYRRAWTPDGAYFFTVVTFARHNFLCYAANVLLKVP